MPDVSSEVSCCRASGAYTHGGAEAASEYGKDVGGDIIEEKRTLMLTHLPAHATDADRVRTVSLIGPAAMGHLDDRIEEVLGLMARGTAASSTHASTGRRSPAPRWSCSADRSPGEATIATSSSWPRSRCISPAPIKGSADTPPRSSWLAPDPSRTRRPCSRRRSCPGVARPVPMVPSCEASRKGSWELAVNAGSDPATG